MTSQYSTGHTGSGSGSGGSTPRAGSSGAHNLITAHAYVPVDRRGWNGQDEIPLSVLYERIHTTIMYGQYKMFKAGDPSMPNHRAHGVLVQVACYEGLAFSDPQQKSFVHENLLRRARQLAEQYRQEGR